VLRRIAATDAPQGVVIVARTPITELDQLDTGEDGTGLVFDAIQDPGNLGTLVRSADAFGARFAIALEGTVDPWNPKAVRSAAGSSFRVPIAQATIDRALDWLRSHSFRLLVADAAGTPVDSITRGQRTALVIGNEGSGVRAAVRAAAHTTVAVPVRGHVESLNAAVAGSVLLYLLTR
jgi:TrmH family RNA methyltransferase